MVYRHKHSHVWGDELVLTFSATNADRVNRLSQADPTLPGFRRGWLFRLSAVPQGDFRALVSLRGPRKCRPRQP